jgi:ParB-like chromosome segregation protein Spo0J
MTPKTQTPKIGLKPVNWLIPYEKNAKLHPTEQIERLAATIKRFGWDQPIVAWTDGTIIKGHGRRLAAISLGLKEVPVWVRDDLSREEADAARIADNAVFGMQYDTRAMQEELVRLMAEEPDFTLDDIGLTEKEKTLLTQALDAPDPLSIMDDTVAVIEAQKEEDAARVEAADGELVTLSRVFGFARITRGQERVVAEFLAEAEEATGLTGPEALIEGLKRALHKGL